MTFRKATNIVAVVVFACVLCCVLGTKALDKAGVDFPEWTGIGATKSTLEGRSYTKMMKPTVKSVSSGKFQSNLEDWIADRIPMRDLTLLEYADIQRRCIEVANFAFSFSAYPTFYNSDTSVVPADKLIVPTASSQNSDNTKAAKEFADLINRLATEHPEIHFVFDALTSPYDSEHNPTYELKSNHYENDWTEKHVSSRLNAENITVINDPIESFEEYRSSWITTEHHWTLERALESYRQIANELGLRGFKYEGAILVSDRWYGARCRLGRDLEFSSDFYDMPTDFSDIEWFSSNGKTTSYGKRDSFLAGNNPFTSQPTYNVYDSYYGSLDVEAINHGENNGRSCLVICVSYAKALKGYIASNYERTVFIDANNYAIKKPLSEYLNEGYDDVIVQLATTSYRGMKQKSPLFFG